MSYFDEDLIAKSYQYIENSMIRILTVDSSALSQGWAINFLVKEYDYTLPRLAKLTGISRASLSRRLKLDRNLSYEAKRLAERSLPLATALEVAKLPREKQLGFARKAVAGKLAAGKVAKLVGLYNAPDTPSGLKKDILENPAGVPLGKGPEPRKAGKRAAEA